MTTNPSAPRLAVTGGDIEGASEDGVFVFRGIPYAAPISGANRWRAPQPVTPWTGVRAATQFGDACPQPVLGRGIGARLMRWKAASRAFMDVIADLGAPIGDDCLNLNVWSPSLDPDAKLPVLVFIHGGSFTGGAGSTPLYDGAALARAGVVTVTINYRLGVMGFVGGDGLFEDGLGIANRGYLDQLQALRWVGEDIRGFGGDPDCVTLMGESAGAASVIALAASPATLGLVRRAISLSGAPLAYPQEECRAFAADYFAALGVARGDAAALVALTPERLLAARPQPAQQLARHADRYGSLGEDRFAVLVAATGTELFPQHPQDFLAGGGRPGLELMIGTCADETRFLTILLPLPNALAARVAFGLHRGILRPKGRPAETFGAYRARMPGASGVQVRERATTNAFFRRPSVALAEAVAQHGRAFLYRFDWPAAGLGGAFGAMHGTDLPGVFQTYGAMAAIVGPEAAARPAGDALHAAVVSFAKTGAPTIPGAPAWPAYDPATKPCMIIDEKCELREDVDAGFDEIW